MSTHFNICKGNSGPSATIVLKGTGAQMVWSREITNNGSVSVQVHAQGNLMSPSDAQRIVNIELKRKRVGDCVLTGCAGLLIDELSGVYWKVPLLLSMSVDGSDNRELNQYALVGAVDGEYCLEESAVAAIKDAARRIALEQGG